MSFRYSFSRLLKVTVLSNQGKLDELYFDKGPVMLGRDHACQVILDFPFVAKSQCQIVEDRTGYYLESLDIHGKIMKRHRISNQLGFRLDTLTIKLEIIAVDPKLTAPINIVKVIAATRTHVETSKSSSRGGRPPGPMGYSPPIQPERPRAKTISNPKIRQSSDDAKAGPKVSKQDGLIDRNFRPELIEVHPGVGGTTFRRLEAVVLWHDQVIEVKEFDPMEKVTIGPSQFAELSIPALKRNWALANVNIADSECQIPKDMEFHLNKQGVSITSKELIESREVSARGQNYSLRLKPSDVLGVSLGSGLNIYLRYIPASAGVKLKKLNEPEIALKHALMGSALMHIALSLVMILTAPKPKNIPQLKNVPERFARLLVEPPKPIIPVPTPTPPPPPPPVQERVKQQVVKHQEVPVKKMKPVPLKQPKQLAKVNKFPIVVKKLVEKAPASVVNNPTPAVSMPPTPKPPVKVESLGALAALGGGPPSPEPITQNININKNAGGVASKTVSMNGMVGALPSASGKILAGGSGAVQTKGGGIGTGTGYGTQGLRGVAGSRGVSGGVVGQPKLASSGRPEGLTRQQVMAVVQKHLAEVQHCYEKSLLSNPDLAGRMEFEWDIEPSGDVTAVRVKRSTVNGGDGLGECVKGVFSSMKFPTAKNNQSTTPSIGFPFGRM